MNNQEATWAKIVAAIIIAIPIAFFVYVNSQPPMKLSEAEAEVWQRAGYAEHVCQSFDIQRINERGVDSRIAQSAVFADAVNNTTDYDGNYSNKQAFVYLTAQCST